MTRPWPAGRPAGSASWPLSRILGSAVLLMMVFSVAAVVIGALALSRLNQERGRIAFTIDPAALAAEQLYVALLNQATGVTGYALSGKPDFLRPYTDGLAAQQAVAARLRPLLPELPPDSAAKLNQALAQARDWRARYAERTIRQVQASGRPAVIPHLVAANAEFNALRLKLEIFQADVSAAREQSERSVDQASTELDVVLLVIAIGLAWRPT